MKDMCCEERNIDSLTAEELAEAVMFHQVKLMKLSKTSREDHDVDLDKRIAQEATRVKTIVNRALGYEDIGEYARFFNKVKDLGEKYQNI